MSFQLRGNNFLVRDSFLDPEMQFLVYPSSWHIQCRDSSWQLLHADGLDRIGTDEALIALVEYSSDANKETALETARGKVVGWRRCYRVDTDGARYTPY